MDCPSEPPPPLGDPHRPAGCVKALPTRATGHRRRTGDPLHRIHQCCAVKPATHRAVQVLLLAGLEASDTRRTTRQDWTAQEPRLIYRSPDRIRSAYGPLPLAELLRRQ